MSLHRRRVLCVFGFLAILASVSPAFAQIGGPGVPPPVTNPFSQFVITVDGQFSPAQEWSDTNPLWFISPPGPVGQAIPVQPFTPGANSLLWATLAPGVVAGGDAEGLYLMYDYLPRTLPFTLDNEFIADIVFPMTLGGQFPGRRPITLHVTNGSPGGDPFHAFVTINNVPNSPVFDAEALGLEVAVGFGPSLLSSTPHLLVEVEVPLTFAPGFGPPGGHFDPQGSSGFNGNGYSPEPSFWGANVANDLIDPPASAAIFTINPDGSTLVAPVTPVPEPSTVALAAIGAALLVATRWRGRAKRLA